jgi:hypothetical protein
VTRTTQLDERSPRFYKGCVFHWCQFQEQSRLGRRRRAAAGGPRACSYFRSTRRAWCRCCVCTTRRARALFKQIDAQKERIVQLYDSMCDARAAFRSAVKLAEASAVRVRSDAAERQYPCFSRSDNTHTYIHTYTHARGRNNDRNLMI